ncbi:hypothetical protein MF406_13075 [Georgenia sp. TF02-10]|uniref:hypothetical protein n=1 Tax=Georgenia sp. TF02-10 TaxID=2917725 RepID=UPI001FA6BA9D|nr:hypothetical protein [Georgenia sp. TF02-10]UNX53897.1 hypothetical protein MF406_13075 [Georgenia sp. TF02-10]
MDDRDRDELHEAMRIVGATLSGAGLRFALAGGFAAWVHGAPESDHDADFVIREADVAQAREALAATDLRVEDPVEDWLFKAWKGDALVDLIFRLGRDPVGEDMLDRTSEHTVFGVPMPVLPATDVLAEKLRVLTEQRCDFGNLLPVARALREQVDWAEVAARTADNPYAAAFLFLLERLGIIAPRDEVGGAAEEGGDGPSGGRTVEHSAERADGGPVRLPG